MLGNLCVRYMTADWVSSMHAHLLSKELGCDSFSSFAMLIPCLELARLLFTRCRGGLGLCISMANLNPNARNHDVDIEPYTHSVVLEDVKNGKFDTEEENDQIIGVVEPRHTRSTATTHWSNAYDKHSLLSFAFC